MPRQLILKDAMVLCLHSSHMNTLIPSLCTRPHLLAAQESQGKPCSQKDLLLLKSSWRLPAERQPEQAAESVCIPPVSLGVFPQITAK